jgi:hypothetical protein
LKAFLIKTGYEQMSNDECLFIKRTPNPEVFSIVSTHVDDLLQVATDDYLVTELHEALVKEYKTITFSPNADAYIGMSIDRSADLSHIKLTQKGLIKKILKEYNPNDNMTSKDPHTDKLFTVNEGGDNGDRVDSKLFLGLVMSLMYLARLTRPDILLSVVYLATRSHCCTKADMREGIRVCRYLRGTMDLGVNIHCTGLQLNCLCDASHNVHVDGKSHTGFMITLGDNFSYLHSRSGKQKLTAQSSTDAEVLAMVECLKTATWMRNIIIELRITPRTPIIIYQDNKSAIIMVERDSKNKRSKHILPKINYAKELHNLGIIEVRYLNTKDMTADMLTKPLHGLPFREHRKTLLEGLTVSPDAYSTVDFEQQNLR